MRFRNVPVGCFWRAGGEEGRGRERVRGRWESMFDGEEASFGEGGAAVGGTERGRGGRRGGWVFCEEGGGVMGSRKFWGGLRETRSFHSV